MLATALPFLSLLGRLDLLQGSTRNRFGGQFTNQYLVADQMQGYFIEHFSYALLIYCRGLVVKREFLLLQQTIDDLCRHSSLFCKVRLVADIEYFKAVASGLPCKIPPHGNVPKAALPFITFPVLVRSKTIIMAALFLRYVGMRLLNLSCPAVSHSSKSTYLPSILICLLM